MGVADFTSAEDETMSPMNSYARGARRSSALLVVILFSAACKPGGDAATDTAAVAAPATPAASPAAAPALNDAQIAHVAVTANSIDSAAGELARTKGQHAQVKSFAQTMIRDHGAVNKQAVALAQKLGVTPEDNDVSRSLQQGAQTARADLEGRSGADFDRAYTAREVEYHQAVLDALDQTLVPGAQNAELKALLTAVRPNFAQHLELARQTQRAVGTQ